MTRSAEPEAPPCPYCGRALESTAYEECPCQREDYDDFAERDDCTHCGGDGDCMDGADPLGDCPDEPHRCHACGGSGRGEDQLVF